MSRPSLPVGVRMTVRRSWAELAISRGRGLLRPFVLIDVARHSGEYALELSQRLAHGNSLEAEREFANGSFVGPAPFLEDRECLANLAGVFEVAEEQDGVGEVADVDGRL